MMQPEDVARADSARGDLAPAHGDRGDGHQSHPNARPEPRISRSLAQHGRLRVVMTTFTLLIDGLAVDGPARVVDGRARLVPDSAWDALGAI